MTDLEIQLMLKELPGHALGEFKEAFVALKVAGFETPPTSVDAIINTRLGGPMVVPQNMVHSLALPIIGTVVTQEPDGEAWKGLLALVEVHYAGDKKIIWAEVVLGCADIMVGSKFFEDFGQELVLAPEGRSGKSDN